MHKYTSSFSDNDFAYKRVNIYICRIYNCYCFVVFNLITVIVIIVIL